RAFQRIDGRTIDVSSAFSLSDDRGYGVTIGEYDRTQPLVIDPAIMYASYLGSSGADEGRGIAVDAAGNAYVTGYTKWIDFPVTLGAYQTSFGGGNNTYRTSPDAFVAKINASGTALVYATYLGGTGGDLGYAIAVDGNGSAYVTGFTTSADFPVTPDAFQTSGGGGSAFVTKLNPTGSALVYSTFYGTRSAHTFGYGIAVDSSGRAYVVGTVHGPGLPGASTGFQTEYADTFFDDGFLARFSAAGNAVEYATYIGGDGWDTPAGVAVNGTDAFVAGQTTSYSFPTTPGAYDATGASPMFTSSDGGNSWDSVHDLRLNAVMSFAIDPLDPNIIFAGTDGHGIYKSTSRGNAFSYSGSGIAAGAFVYAI